LKTHPPVEKLPVQLTIPLTALALALLPGCAFQRATETTLEGDKTTYVGISWFNKTAVAGLQVGKRTSGGSTTLALDKGATETQAEAIKAAGEALGAGIATGVKKVVAP
jgi:hypothetical protein